MIMIIEVPKPLRCVRCGYVAHYLINGTSYCRICAWWTTR